MNVKSQSQLSGHLEQPSFDATGRGRGVRHVLQKIGGALRDQFTPQQGKNWVDNFTSPDQVRSELKWGGIGAAAGAGLGAAAGFGKAEYDISKVPVQSVTEHWKTPQLDHVQIGMIPQGYYSPGDYIPYDDHRTPTVPVYRDNPNTQLDGSITMKDTEQTFTGHGKPEVTWHDNNIENHSMRDGDYSRWTTAVTHQQYDHTETYYVQVANPTTYHEVTSSHQDCVPEYNSSGGTSENCHTVTTTEQVANPTTYHEESRTRDIYRTVTDGYNVSYSPQVSDKVVGHFTSPSVSFDSGISIGADIAVGLGIGAALGMITGGLYGAIKDKISNEGGGGEIPTDPTPAPPSEPTPPEEPKPYYGEYVEHAHNGLRHTHDGGNLWHTHNAPTDNTLDNPLNEDWICFKPGQAPSGYDPANGVERPVNGSISFAQLGRKDSEG